MTGFGVLGRNVHLRLLTAEIVGGTRMELLLRRGRHAQRASASSNESGQQK